MPFNNLARGITGVKSPRMKSVTYLAVLWVLTQLLVNVQPASADTWPQSLGEMRSGQVVTSPSGKVTIGACDNNPTRFRTYNADGSIYGATDQAGVYACTNSLAVGATGVVYGTMYNAQTHHSDVVAYTGSAQLWRKSLSQVGCYAGDPQTYWLDPYKLAVGADGYLYISAYRNSCTQQNFAIKLHPQTGETVFQVGVGTSSMEWFQPYRTGVVFFDNRRNQLDYLNDAGQIIDNSVMVNPTHALGNEIPQMADMDGNVYFTASASQSPTSPCSTWNTLRRITGYGLAGQFLNYAAPACMSEGPLVVTSDERPVFIMFPNHNLSAPQLKTLTHTGSELFGKVLVAPASGYSPVGNTNLRADILGRVMVVRSFVSSTQRYKTTYNLLNPASGQIKASFTADTINLPLASMDGYDTSYGFNAGRLYYFVKRCPDANPACNPTNMYLYRVNMSPVGAEYPRGALLGAPFVGPGTVNYVAMGDSFSSGEGNPPFLEGSDTTVNSCHRSELAYPRLIRQEPGFINAEFFVACSGAKIADIASHWQYGDQPPQATILDQLGQYIDTITLTMGGNDVGFGSIADCVTKAAEDCDAVRAEMRTRINDPQLVTRLKDAYRLIGSKIRSTARIIVVQYPQIFPQPNEVVGTCRWGGDVFGAPLGRQITNSELNDMRDLTALLNYRIAQAVGENADSRITLADPIAEFAGHSICTSSPWFKGVVINADPSRQAYSYHPNQLGQQAYYRVVLQRMQA